jgi:glucose/arabinose dehydrogenase
VNTRLAAPAAAGFALVAAVAVTLAQQHLATTKPTEYRVDGVIYEPQKLQPTDENIANLKPLAGFKVTKYADGLLNARMLAVANDGTVYVTRREQGDVVMLKDENGDGRADKQVVVANRPMMHGILIHDDLVYLATVKELFLAKRNADGTLGELERLIDDLPDGGQHPNRTMVWGPDNMIYLSVGSSANATLETNPEHATILRISPDGKQRSIYASGLRNTIGFDFHPRTGVLWGMDHGIDWLGNDEQPEELNKIEQGKMYGWPYVFGKGGLNPQDDPPGEMTLEQWRSMSTDPVLTYTAHAAPMQWAYYKGDMFPAEFRNDAFVAMRGSWNRKPPSGYEVVRVRFNQDGTPIGIEPFLTGFKVEMGNGDWGQFARLAGLAVAKDGALLVSDDKNGVIYRISYDPRTGNAARAASAAEEGRTPSVPPAADAAR